MDARPSRVRNTIARKQRKLEREQNYEIRLHTGSDVQQAMADYQAIFKASWKANERFEHVIKGFTDSFSKLAWSRLAILYIEGQPVAAQLWFVVHKKASIFRLAYDEAWKHYSPGSILTQYLMKYVIDTDKVKEIDFLTGNDHYKQEWMSERRQRWKLIFTRKTIPEDKGSWVLALLKGWLSR
jgi:CelD/BcsL family acetyltransferase involved in cellulose biosynthesis